MFDKAIGWTLVGIGLWAIVEAFSLMVELARVMHG